MHYLLWAIYGSALTTAFLMHFWLPDPPPLARWLGIILASAVGGIVGGSIASAEGNLMLGQIVLGALTCGLVFGGAAVVLFGQKRAAAAGR